MATAGLERGFNDNKIRGALRDFEAALKDELAAKKGSWVKVNEDLLKDQPADKYKKTCKGLFVGRLFLSQARKANPFYLMATCKRFMIMIPTGPIQSLIHILAIPKEPLYNVVSIDAKEHPRLLLQMQAGLRKVVADILKPRSKPRQLYMKHLKTALESKASDRSHIHIAREGDKLDTHQASVDESLKAINGLLDKFYADASKKGTVEEAVATDFHIHDSCTVGQAHMHGWLPWDGTITDNGKKLLWKNTPLDRILPIVYDFRGVKDPNLKKPRAVVKDKS